MAFSIIIILATILFFLFNFGAILITWYMFFSDMNIDGKLKIGIKNKIKTFIGLLRSLRKRTYIIALLIVSAFIGLDGFIAYKVIKPYSVSHMADILVLGKLHRNVDDLLNNISREIQNFGKHHSDFNVSYKINKERMPNLENVIIDNAFQIIVYAQRNNISTDPEVKRLI